NESVALFCARAQAVRWDFVLTEANAAAVAGICVRLDGMPLALELAAARIKVLSAQAILERLPPRLELLAQGKRGAPDRHKSLQALIDWSNKLLTQREKKLFRRLSVFARGSTLTAVESVCNTNRDLGQNVLNLLASLVDWNLLTTEEDIEGKPRFG